MADLEISQRFVVPDAELSERFSRSSGPGGQGVNTTDSRVELSWDIASSPSIPEWLRERLLARLASRLAGGVLTVAVSTQRAQLANRAEARTRMATLLRAAAAPPPPQRRATKPSRGSKERRLAAKKRRSQTKQHRRVRGDE
ncbi:alternative ribosome rescue aminoacyl-tRNA hydrolase ArfB [Actinophytocola oryzae]|uniref:Ribosome-associated protein n=1 Tax=Actinophytocola oryzae TaxID=502181 RepID=A0A4R7UTM7_9PSEU|nr:ribosome-associated protein [Actinophytocola oryzae]